MIPWHWITEKSGLASVILDTDILALEILEILEMLLLEVLEIENVLIDKLDYFLDDSTIMDTK